MARDLDNEQLEALKGWWERQGSSTVTVILVGVLGFFGYRAYQNSEAAANDAASASYQQLVAAHAAYQAEGGADGPLRTTLQSLGQDLKREHEGTAYAAFAALRLARLAVEAGDLPGAAEELGFALEQDLDSPMQTLALMRLARVQIAMQQPEAALETLAGAEPSRAQRASVAEARGDAHHALGDLDRARDAYREAVESLERGVEDRMLVMKLADLPADGADT